MFHQRLESRPGFRGVGGHPQVNGLAHRSDHLPALGGDFPGQQRFVKRVQADPGYQCRIVNAAAHKRHEARRGLIEQSGASEQQCLMEAKDLFTFGLNAGADLEPTPKMFQRVREVAGLRLTQAEERPPRRGFLFQLDELGEGLAAALVLIAVVGKRTEIPPALRPRGLQLQRFLIKLDRLGVFIRLARGSGLGGQLIEGGCPRVGRGNQSDRGHHC